MADVAVTLAAAVRAAQAEYAAACLLLEQVEALLATAREKVCATEKRRTEAYAAWNSIGRTERLDLGRADG